MPIQRKQNESLKEYKIRLCKGKEDFGLTWVDIADLVGKQTDTKLNESTVRKWYSAWKDGYDYAIENNVSESELDDLTIKKIEIQKERVKLSSEKSEINKWVREQSRSELIFDKIEQAIERVKPINIPQHKIEIKNTDYGAILPLADIHYGKDFVLNGLQGEVLNKYSPEIFEERMWEIFDQTVSLLKKERIQHLHIVLLGDLVEGMLRASQLQKLKYGMVDQVINFSNFLATWLNELSNYVVIDVYSSLGNHSENRPMGSNRGEFEDENMERLIVHILQKSLQNNKNIKIYDAKMFVYFDLLGNKVLATHGQYEKNLEQSIKDYMLAYNVNISLLLTGHYHSGNNKTIGMNLSSDIEYLQSPSICGTDSYAMKFKKASKPGAKLVVLEKDKGISSIHNIKL